MIKIAISGPAWVGKSTLGAELANYLRERGALITFTDDEQRVDPERFGKPDNWSGRRIGVAVENN